MRILFVTPFYYPEVKYGGPPKRLHAMAQEFISRGHEVGVITFNSEAPSASNRISVGGVAVEYLPWLGKPLRQIPRSLRQLKTAVAANDVIHGFGLYNLLCPAAAWISQRLRKPFLLEPMGMFVPRVGSLGMKKLYHLVFTRRMAGAAAAVIATSPVEFNELLELAPLDKLVLRRNGIDLENFRKRPLPTVMRTRWTIPEESKVVLYLGRISRKKNLLELVQAFQQAALPRTNLVITGPVSEVDYLRRIQSEIHRRGLGGTVSVKEPVYGDQLLAALSAADLFVLPSLNENFGNSAAEAVVADVPVLLTETCGIAPIIHARAGMSIPLGVESLAEGLRMMLNPKIRDQMMTRSDEAKRDLSWEQPIRETEELYRRIIAECKESQAESRTI